MNSREDIFGIRVEAEGQRKDGTIFPVHLAVSQVVVKTDGKENGVMLTGIVRDLTEQKLAESELSKAKEIAENSNVAKSEFLANMSHEIRTPLTSILGFTEILVENLTEPENIDAANTVMENGRYLLDLINDILDLSRIESGKLEVENIECSPRQIVADVASLMNIRAKAKGLPLKVEFDGQIPTSIHTDPTRLRQILINVVGNAIKFTESGSIRILVRFLNDGDAAPKLQFDVVDSGIGIPADKLENIFQPFTQADGSMTRRFGGSGLGLSISSRLTELLDGEIAVTSTVGQGSTFSVTISTGSFEDVRFQDADESAISKVVTNVDNTPKTRLDNCRVLLAEDGPDNQRLISFVLKQAGATVSLADNGQIGFELATTADAEGQPFDVILMDMQMPVLDGYSATRKLRDTGYRGPIIALTAHAMSSDRQKCLDAGCDEYLSKPIDRQKLMDLVFQLSSAEKSTQAPLVATQRI